MGWTSTTLPWGMKVKDYFVDMFEGDTDKVTRKVLDSSLIKFHTWYAALEITDKETGARDVIALVVLVHWNENNAYPLSYKEMSEDSGPGMCECPEKILKLLTPTTSQYAIGWRKACWDRINSIKSKPRLKKGHYLVLDHPLTFKGGDTCQVLKIYNPKKGYYESATTKRLYKISRSMLQTLDYQVFDFDGIPYKDLPLHLGKSPALDAEIGKRLNDTSLMEVAL